MMRLRLASLVSLAACGSLALGTTQASTVQVANSAGTGIGPADAASVGRTWPLTLSPAPDDLALAGVSFHRAARGQSISPSSLQVSVSGPFGDDYLAAAVPRLQTPGAPWALVLLVNRPSALLDPVSVHVRLTARRTLGTPVVWKLTDPLTHPDTGLTPALCNLALHGGALGESDLRPLPSRGAALAGFDAASAVAQAYDVVCGLPHASSFEQAVRQSSGCTPCDPPPGSACPLVAQPGICAAPVAGGARRAPAGAH